MSGKDIHTRGRALTSEGRNLPEERAAAVRTVAANAVDAADCAELLDMLGLSAGEGHTTCQGAAVPSPGVRGRAARRRYPTR